MWVLLLAFSGFLLGGLVSARRQGAPLAVQALLVIGAGVLLVLGLMQGLSR